MNITNNGGTPKKAVIMTNNGDSPVTFDDTQSNVVIITNNDDTPVTVITTRNDDRQVKFKGDIPAPVTFDVDTPVTVITTRNDDRQVKFKGDIPAPATFDVGKPVTFGDTQEKHVTFGGTNNAVKVESRICKVINTIRSDKVTLSRFSTNATPTTDDGKSNWGNSANAFDANSNSTNTDLFCDDNYSTNGEDLSEIVAKNTGSYTPYQFNDSLKLTKEEKFTPEIAYASDKK